jgi:hypothetical protein
MIRLYLDSNVFRNLISKEEFRNISDIIHTRREDILCFFSSSHLSDLQNDPSEKKLEDLNFMSTIVDMNYLRVDPAGTITSVLITPLEAFEDLHPHTQPNLEYLLDIENLYPEVATIDPQLLRQFNELLNTPLGFEMNGETPNLLKEMFGEFIPFNKADSTVKDWIRGITKLSEGYFEDRTVYKNVRNLLLEKVKNNFLPSANTTHSEEYLENPENKSFFIKFVWDALNPDGKKKVTFFDFFVNAYLNLDLLGINKEKSKTINFNSMLNDASHAYFATFCDYLVSSDKAFIKKSKTLYRLLGFETEIISTDKLFNVLNDKLCSPMTTVDVFLNKIANDVAA